MTHTGVDILQVREGARVRPAAGATAAERIFTVTTRAPTADLAAIAGGWDASGRPIPPARDPRSGAAIPRAGDAHPDGGHLAVRAVAIFAVGMRQDGVRLAMDATRYFNVRVTYAPAGAAGGEDAS